MQHLISRYLEKYSESEVSQLDLAAIQHQYDAVLVIPAHKETDEQIDRVTSLIERPTQHRR